MQSHTIIIKSCLTRRHRHKRQAYGDLHTRHCVRGEGSFNAAVDLCSPPWNSRDHRRYVHSEAEPVPASVHACAKHNQRPCPNRNPSIVPKLRLDPATIGPSGTTCNPILQLLVEQARFYAARKSIKLGKCFSFHFSTTA